MGNAQACCADREKEEPVLKASAGRKIGLQEENFTITLTRDSADDQVGIEFVEEKKAVKITNVLAGTMMEKWNLANAGMEVKPNDRIISVNGVKGSGNEILDQLKMEGSLRMVISRQAKALSVHSFDGHWRNKQNDSILIEGGKIKWENATGWQLTVKSKDRVVAVDDNGVKFEAVIVGCELHWDDKDVWTIDRQEYIVDNSILCAQSKGMAYRYSQHMESRVPEEEAGCAKWGTIVSGRDLGNGWLCVDERLFLPIEVHNVKVLIPLDKDSGHNGTDRADGSKASNGNEAGARAAPEQPLSPPPTLPAASEAEIAQLRESKEPR